MAEQALLPDEDTAPPLAPSGKDQSRAVEGSIIGPPGTKILGADVPDRYGSTVYPTGPAGKSDKFDPVLSGLVAINRARMSAKDRADAAYSRALQDDIFRSHAAFNAEHATSQDIPTWDEEKMRIKFRTQPIQAFGSVGSVFAILASAFTKRPMINALQGSASALEAIKAGDKEAFDYAFEAWKANTDLAIKRHELEHQEFQDTRALFDSDMAAWHESQKQIALKFGDQQGLFLLSNGMDKEYLDRVVSKAKAGEALREIQQNTTQWNFQELMYQQTLDAIEKNAKDQGLDPNDPKVIANKLVAATRIFGAQGKQTPISAIMAQHFQENPTESTADTAKFFEQIQNAGRRTAEENLAVEQRAQEIVAASQVSGEPVTLGQATMQAEAEWSQAHGAAATARTQLQQAGALERAQLSAATRQAIAGMSDSTKRELATFAESGRDRRAELSAAARKEIAGMNAQARKELEEFLEKGRNTRATTGGVVTKDRIEAKQALDQVQAEIASGKLDGNNPEAVRKRTNELLGESATDAGRAKNLTAPEQNIVTMAPTALKNMSKIMSLIDSSGNLITHVPESLLGEFGGEGQGINAYNITRNQIEYDLLRMNAGGVLSAKAMHAVLDLLPPGSAALNFKRAAFQTEMSNLVDEVQDKVNQIEQQGKKIDPNIWDSLRQFGILPSQERRSLLQRFKDSPDNLGVPELKALSREPLSDADMKALNAYIQQRIRTLQQQ